MKRLLRKKLLLLALVAETRKRLKEKRRLQKKFEKRPWNVGEKVAKEVGRCRGGSHEEKRRSSSEAVEFLREEAKLDHSLSEEELQLSKDQQSQTLMLLQQQQQINQVLLSLIAKMVEKQKN